MRTITTAIAAVAGTLFFSGLTVFAAVPDPSSLVGRITAESVIVDPGVKPLIRWSAALPAGANAGDYRFIIQQVQLQGFPWQIPVAQEGESLSPVALGAGTSKRTGFRTWSSMPSGSTRNRTAPVSCPPRSLTMAIW